MTWSTFGRSAQEAPVRHCIRAFAVGISLALAPLAWAEVTSGRQLFGENDNDPDFQPCQPLRVTSALTANADGSCLADTSGTAMTGWTDDGATVRLTTVGDSVGIGTTSPDEKLEVVGDVQISDASPHLAFRSEERRVGKEC